MKALISILLATTGMTVLAAPTQVDAHRSLRLEVTTGRFQTLPGGADLGYDVSGAAIMIRSDLHGGQTVVLVRARGLDPHTSYPVHVHNQPCSATPPGGSHYQHVAGGPVDNVNEIWPAISTNARGQGVGSALHPERARADAMSIVVHNPANTSIRLACLDLE